MTSDQGERYSRQMRLPQVGPAGQARLAGASVLIVGAGGLGSPVALYLAAAGVGRLGLVEFDRVETSNLHRQVLYTTDDVGRPKLDAAVERLHALNPHVHVEPHAVRLDASNAEALIRRYDVVADGTDTFATRYVVNDACVAAGRPNVFASVNGFAGQASVFATPEGPCYRCLFPEPPPPGLVPSCAEGGVLGAVPGLLGTLQATEVLKMLLQAGSPLVGRLLLFDALDMKVQTVAIDRDPDCPVCGHRQTGHNGLQSQAVDAPAMTIPEIGSRDLKTLLDSDTPPFLLDVRGADEQAIADIGGALLPLNQLPWRVDELASHKDDLMVVHCRSGARSAQAVQFLRERGYNAVNLRGGILAWSAEVDPTVPTY